MKVTLYNLCKLCDKVSYEYGDTTYWNVIGKRVFSYVPNAKLRELWQIKNFLVIAIHGASAFDYDWNENEFVIRYLYRKLRSLERCLKWEFDKIKYKKRLRRYFKWISY